MKSLRKLIFRYPSLIPWITVLHRFAYRLTRGLIGARAMGVDILLLTTTGRKSGQPRTTPLLYLEDEKRFIVVASNGGTERVPAWWLNLQTTPEASVVVRGNRTPVRARQASPEEAESLWPRLQSAYDTMDAYRARTHRQIPIILLEHPCPPPKKNQGVSWGRW